jgi:hypothetical protein
MTSRLQVVLQSQSSGLVELSQHQRQLQVEQTFIHSKSLMVQIQQLQESTVS